MSKKKEKDKKDFMKVRNSRKLYFPIYLMVFILIGVLVFIKYNGLIINKMVFIIVGLFILGSIKSAEIHRLCNSYEVNKNSLVHTMGLFTRKTRSMDFFAISDIEVKQGVWQRLLGFGDVSVRLYSGESDSPVKNINKPKKFGRFLRKMIEARRKEGANW